MQKRLLGFGIPILVLAVFIFIFSQTHAERKIQNPEPPKPTCTKNPERSCTDAPSRGSEMLIDNLSTQFISIIK